MLHFRSPLTAIEKLLDGIFRAGTLDARGHGATGQIQPGGIRTHDLPLNRRSNLVLHHVQLRCMRLSFPRIQFLAAPPSLEALSAAPARTTVCYAIRAGQLQAGRNICPGPRGLIPASLREKYPCTAPSRRLIPAGTNGPRVFCLSYCSLRSKRESNSRPPPAHCRGALPEVTRTLTTPETLAAGISGSGICPLLYPLSYGSSRRRQESNLQPSDPDVTRAFTTPQTFESLLPISHASLLPSPVHTHRRHPQMPPRFADLVAIKIPGGIGAHGDSGFEPEPCGFAIEVAVNFTIPRHQSRGGLLWIETT